MLIYKVLPLKTEMKTQDYPFAQELITDTKGNIRKVILSFNDYQRLIEAIKDKALYPAMIETQDETNVSFEGALREVEKDVKNVIIYTDGSCINNPGSGGYGVVLIHGKQRKELSGGFRLTTNNRMEIIAAIVGLRTLQTKCAVTLYTDSQYLVNAMMKGWAKKWQNNGWKRNKQEKAKNVDLWQELLRLCEQHEVKFVWLRGHSGNQENEYCDRLAFQAAQKDNLPPDIGYENNCLPELSP